MNWVKTEGMTNETAPEGKVVAKYYEQFFGVPSLEYIIAYYDNPKDYIEGGQGWLSWHGSREIKVHSYCKLEDIKED